MPRVIGCILQQHDLRLVALAACICVLSCGVTLKFMALARDARPKSAAACLLTAACVFGGGVWSLHFVAMLAYTPAAAITYDIATTIASAGIAVGGAALALLTWRFAPSRAAGAVAGGVLLGMAVASMHYLLIAAMRFPGTIHFDPSYAAVSVAFGIVFAVIGLARTGSLTAWRRIETALWFVAAIAGMHFTGITALSLELGPMQSQTGTILGSGSLAVAVGSVSLAILIVSLGATYLEQRRFELLDCERRRMGMFGDVAHEAMIVQRGGIILAVNAACGRMFGTSVEQFIGRKVLDLIAEADWPKVIAPMMGWAESPLGSSGNLGNPLEVEARTLAGTAVPVELSLGEIDYDGRKAVVLAMRDLSDRRRDEAAIEHYTRHDALTGLPNRLLLMQRLADAMAAAERSGATVALLNLNLDRFKPVNDLLGHEAGDALLIQAARRLRAELRPVDTLARIGGDEFVIAAVVNQPKDAEMLCARLIEALGVPFDVGGKSAEIGVSIGIALYPGDAGGPPALMLAADTALCRARHDNRGAFLFFKAAMNERLLTRRNLENDLRHAVERDQLMLHYQPLVSCATGEVEGFEALLRWNHPERGLISPADFIPLAEETGLIVPIGEWALETACRTAMRWKEGQWVAVNVSPVQFQQSDLPNVVASALARTGLPASRLEIEITESVFMEPVTRAAGILAKLRDLGVRIALDDFGTGYSSLSYLHTYRFDKLKIDRSFIDRLGQDDNASTIVRTIIGLAHDLGLAIVAEGVETARQLGIVQEFRCDLVQGYLLGRPMRMDMPDELTAARAKQLLFGGGQPVPTAEQAASQTAVLH
jgi:diguanylate cyclase